MTQYSFKILIYNNTQFDMIPQIGTILRASQAFCKTLEDSKYYFHFVSQIQFQVDFDGKISDTAIGKNKTHKKDHITVVDGDKLDYVDHFTPTSGHGRSLATGVVNILAETDSLESLRVIGGGKFYF